MTKRSIRCAVYTRKSSEEGLEQDFNSLDAQREACEAYIRSQKHEGWMLLDTHYDDGGISGATMERPALQRLLDDVRSGRVDVVVVYKVDRLTRSLADFAKIVEAFDGHGVSFVSVTQQFNTTTSMGRLTLNVLLSFAQFEREVTAERIQDKIAASKKKGMWMGGNVPLGYDAKDRSLIVNEVEAEVVRSLFRLYVEHGSVESVVEQARSHGLTTRNGAPFLAGPLYHLLQNPIYVGRIRHKEAVYPGLHKPIINHGLWDAAQAKLADNWIDRSNGTNAKQPSLLAGLLWDDVRRRFTPSHAVKDGKRYRYYIQRLRNDERVAGRKPRLERIPANEIEALVTVAIGRLLGSPIELLVALKMEDPSAGQAKILVRTAMDLAESIRVDAGASHALVRRLLSRVVLTEAEVLVELSSGALREVLDRDDSTTGDQVVTKRRHGDLEPYVISVPARVRMRGVEMRFVIDAPGAERAPEPDPSLIRVVVQGHDWFNLLITGEARSLQDIAVTENVTDRYVRRLIDLAFLAPDIATAILDGTQPMDLTAEKITRQVELPPFWPDQRRLLGFA